MDRPKLYRYAGGVALIGLAILLLLSIASWNPYDPPKSRADYPGETRDDVAIRNVCGVAGAYVGYYVRWVFGTGSYFFVLVIAGVGVVLIAEKTIRDRVVRIVGLAIFLVSWCALIAAILREGGGPGGHGGMIGFLLGKKFLLGSLGFGAYIVAIIGMAVGALLAADVWVFWVGRKSVEMVTLYTQKGLEAAKEGPAEAAPRARKSAANNDIAKKAETADRLAEQKALLRQRLEEQAAARKKEEETEEKHRTDAAADARGAKRKARERAAQPTITIQESHTGEQYRLPEVALLDPAPVRTEGPKDEEVSAKREVLGRTLEEFGIVAQVVEIDRGPVITQFEIELAPGVKINKVASLSDDLARAMKAQSVRIVAPIPGKSTVGVEVPNAKREVVRLRGLFESGVLERKRMTIPLLLGRDAVGDPLVMDLAQAPHILIAGATGSGKSVCINSVIMTLLMTQHPDRLKLLLIDPKMVELSAFRDIPHLMSPVLTDMKKAAAVLEWATKKMDDRYSLLANVGVRNIAAYNELNEKGIRERLQVGPDEPLDDVPMHMPYIVIIIDELADIMMIAAKDVENSITRLAQKSRAVGIHLIVATQRPSVDVVTGLIKANLPSRVAFQTSSKVDSRTILDRNGADKLLGRGDMLFLPPGSSKLIRAQGSYTSDEEIRRVTGFIMEMARPDFEAELVNPEGFAGESPTQRDELFDDAVRIILEEQRGSVSLLQRKLGIGYSRAARLIDMMAEVGLVGDYKGSQAREVLYTLEQWEDARGEE